jgi:hypothetical protein
MKDCQKELEKKEEKTTRLETSVQKYKTKNETRKAKIKRIKRKMQDLKERKGAKKSKRKTQKSRTRSTTPDHASSSEDDQDSDISDIETLYVGSETPESASKALRVKRAATVASGSQERVGKEQAGRQERVENEQAGTSRQERVVNDQVESRSDVKLAGASTDMVRIMDKTGDSGDESSILESTETPLHTPWRKKVDQTGGSEGQERSITTPTSGRGLYAPNKRKLTYQQELEEDINQGKKLFRKSLLILSDSMMKFIPTSDRVQVTAWNQNWDLNMVRGGKIRMLRRMIEEEEVECYHNILISFGTNDLDDAVNENSWGDDKKWQLIKSMYSEIMVAVEKGCKVWILAPLPRRSVQEAIREDFTNGLLVLAEGNPSVEVIDYVMEREQENFIYVALERDGVHLKAKDGEEMLSSILYAMELPHDLGTETKIKFDNFLERDACWRCGERHYRGGQRCGTFDACIRCGSEGHCSKVCLAIAKMCFRCGRRGHKENVCNY